jgi:homoserine O-acetyltransferase
VVVYGEPLARDDPSAVDAVRRAAAVGQLVVFPTSFDCTHLQNAYCLDSVLDPERKRVVIQVNMLGNGVSFSPSTDHDCVWQRYEQGQAPGSGLVTMRDQVTLCRQALGEAFFPGARLPPLVLFGYSMGAMFALTWAAMFPAEVHTAVAICGASRCNDYNAVFLDALAAALRADPAYRDIGFSARPNRGLSAFATIYAGWGVGDTFYKQKVWAGLGFKSMEDFVQRSYIEDGFGGANACDLLAQLSVWRSSSGAGAPSDTELSAVRARVLLLPCTQDRYFTVDEVAAREATLIQHAVLAPIDSPWGHRAGDPGRPGQEVDLLALRERVCAFLAPASL